VTTLAGKIPKPEEFEQLAEIAIKAARIRRGELDGNGYLEK
jgi:hypothetical protein